MSRTRDLGKIISGNFDVPASSLDNSATAVNNNINTLSVTRSNISDLGTGALSNRNLIINGAMQVEQRGAHTISTTGSPEYGGPDRFHMWSYTSGEQVVAEISKSTVGGTPTGFANTCRIDVLTAESSVAAGEALVFAQYIEAQNCQHLDYGTSDAKSVTLSFWIKTSVTGTYCFFLQNDDGDRLQVKEYTVSSANTWEKKTITITGDVSGTINNNSGRGLWCGWVLMAGTDRAGSKDEWRTTNADYATSNQVNAVNNASNNIYITGVQLEVGDTATPFEHRSYSDELEKCQRYYFSLNYPDGSKNTWLHPIATNSNGGWRRKTVHLPVSMRAAPSVSASFVHSGGSSGVDGGTWTGVNTLGLYVNNIASENDYAYAFDVTADAEL